jgi:hypothetical protein
MNLVNATVPYREVGMAEVLDRDLELYKDFGRGVRKVDLAQRYGVDRDTVTAIIRRVQATMPERDRTQVFDQSLEIIDSMLATYIPPALDQDKGAARIVDRFLGRRNALLGLENPQRLELFTAQNQVQHERVDVRAELAQLLAKIRGDQHAAT